MTTTTNTPTTPTTAVTVWNATTEADVRATIAAGRSVSKAIAAVAPKGFLTAVRNARKGELKANSTLLLAQLAEKKFKLTKMGEVKFLKDGRQVITLGMEAPAPTRKMTAAELVESFGIDEALAAAMVEMAK